MDEKAEAAKLTTGLILSGGGARAAYQVGVLKGVADILPNACHNPFGIICGTSAGAINAAGVAVNADNFRHAVNAIESIWANFTADQVYRTDPVGAFARAGQWAASFVKGTSHSVSLLDNSPLEELLEGLIEFPRIQQSIDNNDLKALSVTVSGYSSGQSVSFFQGINEYDSWRRHRRIGVKTIIKLEHLMASSAIPTIFPAVRINREYFGDGAVRQLAPISPALHLGADRVMVIGVSGNMKRLPDRTRVAGYPSVAQIVGHVLNSAFLDSLESDLERLERINNTLSTIPESILREGGIKLRPVGVMTVSPSQCLGTIAHKHAQELPRTIRMFMRGSGATESGGSSILSYLLFVRGYTQELIQLGYKDSMERAEEIYGFLKGEFDPEACD